jgi:hypothetical protein
MRASLTDPMTTATCSVARAIRVSDGEQSNPMNIKDVLMTMMYPKSTNKAVFF